MGANQSNLSSPEYGYDFVLAVTQDSIGAAALAFLNSRQPVVSVCYVYDDKGDPKQIGLAELVRLAEGTDPFALPAGGPDLDRAVDRLDRAGFMFGFQAAMGLPAGFEPAKLPPIVTLGASVDEPVAYRLLCRTFRLVELKAIPHKRSVLQVFDQPRGPKAGGPADAQPWVFSYQVPLVHDTVADTAAYAASAAFQGVPADVRSKVTASPEDFTIKRLLFGFRQAAATIRPEITGVSGVLREKLYADFSLAYFDQLGDSAPAAIVVTPKTASAVAASGVSATSVGSLAGLQTEFGLTPSPAAPALTTLDYLCTGAGRPMPKPKAFGWRWVEPSETAAFDGVCAMNRAELVRHLKDQLDDLFLANRWALDLYIQVLGLYTHYKFAVEPVSRSWKPGDPNASTLVEKRDEPVSGPQLLKWSFAAERADRSASGPYLLGRTLYELEVTCSGTTIVVKQHTVVYCLLYRDLITHDAHFVNWTAVETFTLSCTNDGRLTATSESKPLEDHSESISADDFWEPGLTSSMANTKQWVEARRGKATVRVPPLTLVNTMVFPGGKGFLFKDASFSDHQDLVARITYADPS